MQNKRFKGRRIVVEQKTAKGFKDLLSKLYWLHITISRINRNMMAWILYRKILISMIRHIALYLGRPRIELTLIKCICWLLTNFVRRRQREKVTSFFLQNINQSTSVYNPYLKTSVPFTANLPPSSLWRKHVFTRFAWYKVLVAAICVL